MKVVLKSELKCPHCGHAKVELMPIDSRAQHFKCESCNEVMMVPEGVCCVFCAFGDSLCPKSQLKGTCSDKQH
ncbi:GDCCVxC domain-containing (seleno)protein [Enterovibrio qingdaonensis]|uniref:GDCCVxC domain-containing (seleno)protein n=1 Tax=Enterovibrio qingdaonensis TaxID=2899818 RepID=UPI002364334F|nr:GDCCVxC domain-containing (seleno)protein [Enterovibrio sp. ZSDZ35]